MSERYWYQDGGTVLVIAVVGFLGYCFLQKAATPYVVPSITGHVDQPLFGSPSLIITIWHEHTGVLRNGRLTASVSGEMVETRSGLNSQSHSFEVWEPNRDRAVTLTFPLKHFDPERDIPISITLVGKDIQPYMFKDIWLGDMWASNPKTNP